MKSNSVDLNVSFVTYLLGRPWLIVFSTTKKALFYTQTTTLPLDVEQQTDY